jgi:hypothetical protein
VRRLTKIRFAKGGRLVGELIWVSELGPPDSWFVDIALFTSLPPPTLQIYQHHQLHKAANSTGLTLIIVLYSGQAILRLAFTCNITTNWPSHHCMAGIPRPAPVAPTRKNSMRPPQSRAHSVAPPSSRSGAVSPAESVVSTATTAAPNGTKRKERDYEQDGGEETNINVVVRCRGRNEREVRENSGVVLSTDGVKGKTVELSMGPSALSNKTYHFDKVFSPAADQSMIYDDVVTPILDEVTYLCFILKGFC